jgi:PAS domain S-box-containing protein
VTPPELGIAELKAILGALPELVVLIDEERKIRFINRAEAGYHAEEVLGQDVNAFVVLGARAEYNLLLDGVFEGMGPAAQLTEVIGAGGEQEWYEGTMLPIVRDGRVASVIIVTRNVTASRLAEEELTMLRSLLPVCAWCKKIRTDEDEWQPLETYLEGTSASRVTHGVCPDCERTMFGEADLKGA